MARCIIEKKQPEKKAQNLARSVAYSEDISPVTDRISPWNVNKNENSVHVNTFDEIIRKYPPKTVTADVLNIRSTPGLNGQKNGKFTYGDQVIVDADSAVTADGYTWVKIVSGDKTGWVATEYLEDVKQKEKLEITENVSYDEPSEEITESEETPLWDSDHVGWMFLDKIQNGNSDVQKYDPKDKNEVDMSKVDPNATDQKFLQEEFNKVRKPDWTENDQGEFGDFDGAAGLECPDVVKWYLDKFTTLKPVPGEKYIVKGDGCNIVGDLKDKYGFESSIIPSAPAVYSVAPDTPGPGVKYRSDKDAGHTGIILDVKIDSIPEGCTDPEKFTYSVTYFHTYSGCNDKGYISSVNTKKIIPSANVTYVNIGECMK